MPNDDRLLNRLRGTPRERRAAMQAMYQRADWRNACKQAHQRYQLKQQSIDVEDLFQMAFTDVIKKLLDPTFTLQESLRAYYNACVWHRAAKLAKRVSLPTNLMDNFQLFTESLNGRSPLNNAVREQEFNIYIDQICLKLGDTHAKVFRCRIESMPQDAIAARLGIDQGNVRYLVRKNKEFVEKILVDDPALAARINALFE